MKSESGWTPIDEFNVSADNSDQNRLNQPPNHVDGSSEIYGLRTKFVFTSNLDYIADRVSWGHFFKARTRTYVEGNGENSPAEHADERHDQSGEVSSTGDGQLRGERRAHQRAEHQADHSKPVGVFLYNLTTTTTDNGQMKSGE